MMLRTHTAITLLFVLLFLPHVHNPLVFSFVAVIATLIPDADSAFSSVGRLGLSKVAQVFVRHRGMLHSFTFCIIVSVLIALFFPTLALAFFLGYSLHIFVDSFTVDGIAPFWPWKAKSKWRLRTGSVIDTTIFTFFVFLDIVLFVFLFRNMI